MFSEKKINFIIHLFVSNKQEVNGGIICLHKLSYHLASRGHKVLIFTDPIFPHPNIIVQNSKYYFRDGSCVYEWEPFSFPLENTVSIYPEVILGNCFNTKHVARWILYYPSSEVEKTFGETDYYFHYSSLEDVNYLKSSCSNGELTVVDLNLDKFYIENKEDREGYCCIDRGWGKCSRYEFFEFSRLKEELKAKDLFGSPIYDPDYLRSEFNKFKYFITPDDKTYYTSIASLCGCIPIVLSRKNLLPFEFRSATPAQRIGVAYGFDDIEWAEKTMHLTRTHLLEYDKFCQKTVDNFIYFLEDKIDNLE